MGNSSDGLFEVYTPPVFDFQSIANSYMILLDNSLSLIMCSKTKMSPLKTNTFFAPLTIYKYNITVQFNNIVFNIINVDYPVVIYNIAMINISHFKNDNQIRVN